MSEPVWTVRPVDALEEKHSDLGNARRLARLCGSRLRYVQTWNRWLVYDGRRWAIDQTGEVERMAKYIVDTLPLDSVGVRDEAQRARILKHAITSQGLRPIRNMIALAQTELGIAATPEAFDRDPYLLNVQNGTLDLRTATLRPHRREDALTKLISVEYDPSAACPTFDRFLERIFDGQRSLIDYMQKFTGYSLTGDISEQCFLLLWGAGANGKTTLTQTLGGLLGDYAATVAAETLLAHRGDAGLVMNDLATLHGARFVVAVESDMGRHLAEALVKAITGGETLKVKRLYADVYALAVTFKLWVGTNHKPVIRGTDRAIWRRIRLVPFTVSIPDSEQDRQLLDKLHAERAGILRWAVEGCLAWQRDGLGTPEEVRLATADYRREMDRLVDFLTERCVIDPAASIPIGDLYKAYREWAANGGENAVSKRELGALLDDRDFTAKKIKCARRPIVITWIGAS